MKVGEYLCIGDEETPVKETLVATNAQDDADCLPLPPLTPQDELTPPSVSPHPSKAQSRSHTPMHTQMTDMWDLRGLGWRKGKQ